VAPRAKAGLAVQPFRQLRQLLGGHPQSARGIAPHLGHNHIIQIGDDLLDFYLNAWHFFFEFRFGFAAKFVQAICGFIPHNASIGSEAVLRNRTLPVRARRVTSRIIFAIGLVSLLQQGVVRLLKKASILYRPFPIRTIQFICAGFLPAFLAAQPLFSQSAKPLPNAPSPQTIQRADAIHPSFHPTRTSAPSKWDAVVDPGEQIPPLTSRDKMLYWIQADTHLVSWYPTLLSAGWEQLIDGHPKYGSDSAAFGERLGATVLRENSARFFSNSLLPVVTHEDPRYYRKAYGPIKARGVYAAERVFVSRRDDGSSGFNASLVLGNLAASALTPTYYPAPSANARVVVTSWLLSFLGSAGGNLFQEFWPDGRDALFHRHRVH